MKFDKSVFPSNAKCRSLPWLVSFFFFFMSVFHLFHNCVARLDYLNINFIERMFNIGCCIFEDVGKWVFY